MHFWASDNFCMCLLNIVFFQIALYRYQEAVDLKTQCGSEADLHGQRHSFGAVNQGFASSNEMKTKAIKTRYQVKINILEQELNSCIGELTAGIENQNKVSNSQNETIDADAEKSKAAIRSLAYEIDVAQERVKAEEARGVLWTMWSAAAERTASHRPKDQSLAMAFDLARASRRKVIAAVQTCVKNEEEEGPNAHIPSWMKKEPAWPANIKHDVWWPMKTAADNEKTGVALIASADRAVNLARKRIYCISAEPATKHLLHMETRGKIALVSAQEAQRGSAKIISELDTAANHFKQLFGPIPR
jgi:hypothetical protein